MATSNYDIEAYNLTKKYTLKQKGQEIIALSNVNLKIKKGEIFGLLGPNGAGKTTLVSILTTLIKPTSGYGIILGHNILKEPWFVKENVGLMLGGEMIYYRLTGYRNLKFFSKLYGIKNYKKKIMDLAEKFDLTKWLNEYVSNYSTGMKLKLALARTLLIDPKILFLDEPMYGLDPSSVKDIIEVIKSLNKTILLTSHQMGIVEQLCGRIAFLNQGEILKIDTQENFKKLITDKINIRLKIKEKKESLIKLLDTLNFIEDIRDMNDWVYISIKNENYLPELFKYLKDYSVIRFNQIEPDLNEVFIKLVS